MSLPINAVRIVSCDYYMSAPIEGLDVLYSEFRGSSISQVPVIRVFGATNTGKKMCLHVHGVFPYLYIPFDGTSDPNILIYHIASSLDKALNIFYGQATSTAQHIYKISLVSGIPFYGYHLKEHQFFKISLYNPIVVKRVSAMLQNDGVMGKIYQPHEAHINYILQFMIDYNLHGMSNINLSNVKLRDSANFVAKLSTCELEGDTLAENIENRLQITSGSLAVNPGIAALWEDEQQRRRDHNAPSQISPCLSLTENAASPTKSHKLFQQVLKDRLLIQATDDPNKVDPNLSVYPAETPPSQNVTNASVIDFQTPNSQSSDSFLDVTLNSTFDEDANDLLNVLQDLEEKNNRELKENDNRDEDSILSQMNNEDDDYLDMTLPLEALNTPVKLVVDNQSDEDLCDTTLVPQFDGNYDSSSSDEDRKHGKDNLKKYRALPISVSNDSKEKLGKKRKIQETDSVKRKLSFINSTVVEEKIECNYKRRRRKSVKRDLSNRENDNFINDDFGDNRSKTEEFSKQTSTDQDFKEHNFTVAELYDVKNNFRAKEGNSNVLTQNMQQSSNSFDYILRNQSESCSSQENDENKIENSKFSTTDVDFKLFRSSNLESSRDFLEDTLTDTKDCFSSNFESTEKLKALEELVLSSFDSVTKNNLEDIFQTVKEPEQEIKETNVTNVSLDSDRKENLEAKDSAKEEKNVKETVQDNRTEEEILTLQSKFCIIVPKLKPPSKEEVIQDLPNLSLSKINYQKPFYSEFDDVTGSVEVGYSVLKINSQSSVHLPEFKSSFPGLDDYRKNLIPPNCKLNQIQKLKLSYCGSSDCLITPLNRPPTRKEVLKWHRPVEKCPTEEKQEKTKIFIPKSPGKSDESEEELELSLVSPSDRKQENSGRITGVTLNDTFGFQMISQNFQDAKAVQLNQCLTVLVLELHVRTRGDFKPNPELDEVRAIFYSILSENSKISKTGFMAVNTLPGSDQNIIRGTGIDCEAKLVETETELIDYLVKFVQDLDPDIVAGYEIEMQSWGYLIDRAYVLGINLSPLLSRIKGEKVKQNTQDFGDKTLKLTGRIVLDVWRLMRHEISIQSYTFESIVYHFLHQRVPKYSFKNLTHWWDNRCASYRHRTADYYLFRVEAVLKLLDQLDLIGRTSELARLFGIQFYEVLSRGSQFRVESMMLRLAKPLNYIAVSPSVQQRANMKAPEFLPLILEPESKLYVDPVIVLDFQSLYPSIIIAYNYCFSTCLGKIERLGKNRAFEFGATQLKVPRRLLEKLLKKDCLNFSPSGVAFVKPRIREGIMPRMLREIIDTRLMVKNSMKENKDNKILQKVLHNRQLGLKLIANVTYGYTAANFSGRMPAVELGDSVVSKGRETLQRAITMVENTKEWGAKVVYGDTDSLFVMVPGKTKSEAFEIGQKIAQTVTNDNPNPVKLKLEKIYHPCILQTKKRYVGYMYENPEQQEPVYDAKGIETVRRDGCPAVSKMLEKCLKLLFETKDVSLVKKYVLRQFHKILAGRVTLQDLTFAKEYRGASRYQPGACVPALELAKKWTSVDKRSEPRCGERVPYIIINGPPGLPLIRLVRSPHDFFSDPSLRPNALYYITKVIIPPINRCFNLIGADLSVWFNQMPRKQTSYLPTSSPGKKSTISQYFSSSNCAVCGQQTQKGLCEKCKEAPQKSVVVLAEKVRIWERSHFNASLICQSCTKIYDGSYCVSLDCPVLYRLSQTSRDFQQAAFVRQLIEDF